MNIAFSFKEKGYKNNFGLFALVLYFPFNNYGHIWTLPPFDGTSKPIFDVMTYKMCKVKQPKKTMTFIYRMFD